MDLYNQLVTEVLVSDISTKGWREFVAKYSPQAHRRDLFVQFTNFASSTDDKRLVGALAGRGKGEAPEYGERQWSENRRKLGAKAARTPEPDITLWQRPQHGDPTAIYTYPLEFVISEQAGIPYAFNSRYLRVIKLRPGAKVVDLQTVTKDAARVLLQAMGQVPAPQVMSFENFWKEISVLAEKQYAPHHLTAPKIFFWAVQNNLRPKKSINGVHISSDGVADHNMQRARFLRAGITVVIDNAKGPEDAVVFHGEPEQAFFMRSDAFDIIDVFNIAQQKKGEYNPTVWNTGRGERKIISRIANAIDPRDTIIRMGSVDGGVQAFSDPLPVVGRVNLAMPMVGITKRGRAIAADVKYTDKGEGVPDKPKHRQEGQHLNISTKVTAYTEGGVIDYNIGRDQTLDDGVNHIARLAHDQKPKSEWRPVRGVDPRAEVWRDVLRNVWGNITLPDKTGIDLDHLTNTAPHVVRGLAELLKTVGWNWETPKTEWEQVAAWVAASRFYITIKQTYKPYSFKEGMQRVMKLRDTMKQGGESAMLSMSDFKKLEGSKVFDMAKTIMTGTCAEGFYDHQWDNLLNGMAELFDRRYLVMTDGTFSNFRNSIDKDLPKLIEDCDILNYQRALKDLWLKMLDGEDSKNAYDEFFRRTGEHPRPEWAREVSEMVIGRNYDPPTPQQNSAPAQSISRQNPVGKLSPDLTFQSAIKPAQVRNPRMAAARRAVEKAVKRTLSWATDHNTGSATAYIGNGRKVRLYHGNRVSVGPRVTPLDVNRMPSDEQLAKLLA